MLAAHSREIFPALFLRAAAASMKSSVSPARPAHPGVDPGVGIGIRRISCCPMGPQLVESVRQSLSHPASVVTRRGPRPRPLPQRQRLRIGEPVLSRCTMRQPVLIGIQHAWLPARRRQGGSGPTGLLALRDPGVAWAPRRMFQGQHARCLRNFIVSHKMAIVVIALAVNRKSSEHSTHREKPSAIRVPRLSNRYRSRRRRCQYIRGCCLCMQSPPSSWKQCMVRLRRPLQLLHIAARGIPTADRGLTGLSARHGLLASGGIRRKHPHRRLRAGVVSGRHAGGGAAVHAGGRRRRLLTRTGGCLPERWGASCQFLWVLSTAQGELHNVAIALAGANIARLHLEPYAGACQSRARAPCRVPTARVWRPECRHGRRHLWASQRCGSRRDAGRRDGTP